MTNHLHQHMPCLAITANQAELPEAAGTASHNGHIAADGFQVHTTVRSDLMASKVLARKLNVCQLNILQGTSAMSAE